MASKHRKTSSKDIRKLGKGPRERERQIYDDEWNSNEHESFPQFCMTCEKQFFDANERQLYCSAKCQQSDENSSGAHMPMDYGFLSSTYDTRAITGQYNSYNYYNTSASVGGAERPLPPRHGYRPKSIELVTPMLSR
ncbi:Life-span regulatory factor [Ceratocystis platani]|uniref:Life-span regulatory factor n=1 Tax=Ceratocystis fimbriata f. sp. platani TaxID=88771 RepID=A0A0F8B0R6_CERFI|nr:Life-span regulatory factor [Ceratocystis platani]